MIKYVTVLFRRAGLSREEFSRYWKNTHAPVLKEIPGLSGGTFRTMRWRTSKETSRLTTGSANSPSTAWRPCKKGLPVRKVKRLLPTSLSSIHRSPHPRHRTRSENSCPSSLSVLERSQPATRRAAESHELSDRLRAARSCFSTR